MKKLIVLSAILLKFVVSGYAAPEAISDLTALASGSAQSVTLEWTVPDCGGSKPDSYSVRWATSEITSSDFFTSWVNVISTQTWGTLANVGTVESRSITTLTPGATLYFAIKAVKNGEYGVWFSSSEPGGGYNTAASTCVPNFVPADVQGFQSQSYPYYVDLSWNKNSDIDIQSYEIFRSSWSDTNGFSLLATILQEGSTHQDTGLVNGNRYYYKIRAKDNTDIVGSFGGGSPLWGSPQIIVGTPVQSSDTVALSSTSVKIAWNLASNATAYRLVMSSSTSEIVPGAGYLSSSTTFFIRNNLTPNTSAQVYIVAMNGLCFSTSSIVQTFTQASVPNSLVVQNVNTKDLKLQWGAGENSNGTRYYLERKPEDGTYAQIAVLTNGTTHFDTGLTEGVTYHYQVRARNNDGLYSNYSGEISTVTLRIPPDVPTIDPANSGPGNNDGDLKLQWKISGDDGSSDNNKCSSFMIKLATYVIDSSNYDLVVTNSVNSNTVSLSSTVAVNGGSIVGGSQQTLFTGLYPGSTFWFAIKAIDAGGNYSDISNVLVLNSQDLVPGVPASFAAVGISSSVIQLSWNYPSAPTGYNDLDKYYIYRSSDAGFAVPITTITVSHILGRSSTVYIDTGLIQDVTYYYKIVSVDKGDDPGGYFFSNPFESDINNPTVFVSTKTPDTTPPGSIIALNATPGSTEGIINLSWTVPGDDGYQGNISGGKFRIGFSTSSASQEFSTSTAKRELSVSVDYGSLYNYTVTGLNSGTTYYFKVWTADERNNWSLPSVLVSTKSQVDVTAPDPISVVSVERGWRQAKVTWTATGDDGSIGSIKTGSSFIVYIASFANISESNAQYVVTLPTACPAGSQNSYTKTGLTNGIPYYFKIKTMDESGNVSGWSLVNISTTPLNNLPAAFTLKTPANGNITKTVPTLSWNATTDPDSVYGDTMVYEVWYSSTSDFTGITTHNVETANTSISPTLEDYWENMPLYWKVAAKDLDGAQKFSTDTRVVWINLENSAPAGFSLFSPSTGTIVTVQSPTVQWNPSYDLDPGDTVTYILQYSNLVSFSTYTQISNITTTSYVIPNPDENALYYWRVIAVDGVNSTAADSSFWFYENAVDEAPMQFSIVSPADGYVATSKKVTFDWAQTTSPDPGSTVKYSLVYSLFSDFAASTTISNINTNSITTTLPYDNKKYFWKVNSIASNGLVRASNQSSYLYVDLQKELPAAFNLTDPTYGVVISTTLKPWFLWAQTQDPDPEDTVRYFIELSIDPNFVGSQAIPTSTDNFYQPIENLIDQATYYWRVRASGFVGTPPQMADSSYVFSPTWNFTISMTNSPPNPFNLTSPADGSNVLTKLPVLHWETATDSDFNDSVKYSVYLSSTSDYSVMIASAILISTTYFQVPSRLFENKTYWWKVAAVDKVNNKRFSTTEFSFTIPVLSSPSEPVGLSGRTTIDQKKFTMFWEETTLNTDGSEIDDLAGYNIYRSPALTGFNYASPITSVPSGTHEWSDQTVSGGKYYYTIRSVDTSGVESASSMIMQSLDSEKLNIVSSDSEISVELPSDVSSGLLAANNKWQKNLVLNLARKTGLEGNNVLRAYEIKVTDKDLNHVAKYEFSSPLTLQCSYSPLEQAQSIRAPVVFKNGELQAFWDNGIEYVRLGGYMDADRKKMTIKVISSGNIELRQVARGPSFGIASMTPSKVFTPGVAPYSKMTFIIDNPSADKVTGQVFDLKGELVADLEAVGDPTATTAILSWDGSGAAKGVYIYQIKGEGKNITGTIILAR